jgi:hypothetical protein
MVSEARDMAEAELGVRRSRSWHHLPAIYFLHVPKTAGTSVRAWLEQLFPIDSSLAAHHLSELESLSDDAILACDFASGHFGWRFVERARAAGRPVGVFTFLREPLSLRLSALNYAATRGDDGLELMPPDAARVSQDARLEAERALKAGVIDAPDFDPKQRLSLPPEVRARMNTYVQCIAGYGFSAERPIKSDFRAVWIAANRMRKMLAVGVVEEAAWSMAVLCDALGLPYLPLVSRRNTSKKGIRMTDRYAAMTRAMNPHNETLYKLALALLVRGRRRLLMKSGLEVGASVEALRQPMRATFLRNRVRSEKVSAAEISMADGLIVEGFVARSYYPAVHRWIRWAGPELTSTVYLSLDRSADRTIRFDVAATVSDFIRDGLTLSVDGVAIPLERTYETWTDGHFHLVCSGVIPQKVGDADIPLSERLFRPLSELFGWPNSDPFVRYTALDFSVPEVVATEAALAESMGPAVSFALADIRIS